MPTKAKARLVLQGCKDPDLGDLEPRGGFPHAQQRCSPDIFPDHCSMKWHLFIADVKGAFMTSRPLDREGGAIYASFMKLWDLNDIALPEQLILVKVAWYGLNDGPKEFYETLVADLFRLGCKRSSLDPCVFMWFKDGSLQGIPGFTVDDVLGGGTPVFHKSVIDVLGERFPFGKVQWKEGGFTGRDVRQESDFSICLNQDFYVDSLELAEIPRKRRIEKQSPLTDDERTLLCAKAGEQNHYKDAKAHRLNIKFPSIPGDAIRFACTADSALANTTDLSSHMGYMILASDQTLDQNQDAPFTPLMWKAHKQKRKAVSTLSAEAMATGVGIGSLDWIRVLYDECTHGGFNLEHWEHGISGRQ
eukprot:6472001-Amphidinium_carterae.7